MALFANAFVSFFIAFFWHGKVILILLGRSDWTNAYNPRQALADPKTPQVTFGRFIAGQIYPDLRRTWAKAVGYAFVSFLLMLGVAGLMETYCPGAATDAGVSQK